MHVVGDEEVDLAIAVEVGGDHAQPAAVAVDDPRLGRDVRRTGRRRCGRHGRAAPRNRRGSQCAGTIVSSRDPCRAAGSPASHRRSGRRRGPGRRRCRGRRTPPRSASRDRRRARLRGHVLERAVAPVAIQGIGPPAGHEQVGVAVVVVVAHGDAVAVAARHGRRCPTGR